MAISIGNYWQGIIAESMGYAVVLYLDALFAMLVILVIPFLREREERSDAKLASEEPLLAPASGGTMVGAVAAHALAVGR